MGAYLCTIGPSTTGNSGVQLRLANNIWITEGPAFLVILVGLLNSSLGVLVVDTDVGSVTVGEGTGSEGSTVQHGGHCEDRRLVFLRISRKKL
jgi:hypothetical protein